MPNMITSCTRAAAVCVFLTAAVSMMPTAPAAAQTPQQRAIARFYVDALARWDWMKMREMQHPDFTSMTTEKWREMMRALQAHGGELQRTVFRRAGMNRDMAEVVFRAYFERDSIDMHVLVDATDLVGGFSLAVAERDYAFRPPAYADTSRFREKEVQVGNTLPLPGTLCIPRGAGPFPAVVLLQAAGPHDRDETYKGNKPMRDLAWGLASQGIMVLRYDKRTHLYPNAIKPAEATIRKEIIDDAVAAVQMLRNRPDVDANRIVVAGHGLGGVAAPSVAKAAKVVRGIVLLGATARPLETAMTEQVLQAAARKDTLTAVERAMLDTLRAFEKLVRTEKLLPAAHFMKMPVSYFFDLHRRDAVRIVKALPVPVLVVHGGRDFQCTEEDRTIWENALRGHPQSEVFVCEDCTQLMIPTSLLPGPATFDEEGNVSPEVVSRVAAMVKGLNAKARRSGPVRVHR